MLSSLLRRLAGIARRIVAAIWRTNTSINPPTNGLSNRAIDMPIPSSMGDLSVTESSNSPNGSDAISTGLDNYLRAIQSIVRSTNFKGPDIASASSVAIGASTGEFLTVTGTTGITSFDSVSAGIVRTVLFSGSLTLTHGTNIQLPGSANYTTTAGDVLVFRSLGSGQWKCVGLLKASGPSNKFAINTSSLTVNNSITLQAIPGCSVTLYAEAGTYLVDVFIKGTQGFNTNAGIRVALDVTSGPTVSDGEVYYQLSDYANFDTSATVLSSSDSGLQSNVTTASCLMETSQTLLGFAAFLINGKGHITFSSSGAATIGLYAAQNVAIASDTQIQRAHLRLTRQE